MRLILVTLILTSLLNSGQIYVPDGQELEAKKRLLKYPNLMVMITEMSNQIWMLDSIAEDKTEQCNNLTDIFEQQENKIVKLKWENRICKGTLGVIGVYIIFKLIENAVK